MFCRSRYLLVSKVPRRSFCKIHILSTLCSLLRCLLRSFLVFFPEGRVLLYHVPMRTMKKTTVVAINCAAMAQHGILLLLLGPMVPNIMEYFSITESTAGLLLSMGSFGFLFGPLLAGILIDKTNIKAALIVGLSIEIVFFLLFGLSPLFYIVLVANFVLHLGGAFVETAANVLPSIIRIRMTPLSLMNIVHAFFSVGAFIGPFLIGLYLDSGGTWYNIYFFMMVPTGLLLFWTFLTPFPGSGKLKALLRQRRIRKTGGKDTTHKESAASTSLERMKSAFREPSVIFGSFTLLFYVGAEVSFSAWLVLYCRTVLSFSTVESASALSVLWLCIMVGRYGNSLLANRFGAKALVTFSGLGGAIGVGVFLMMDQIGLVYILVGWIGLCLSGIFPNVMGEINGKHPNNTGTVTAFMTMGAALGATIFQWFMGFLAETIGLRSAFITTIILQVLLVGCFLMALRDLNHRRRSYRR